MEYKAHLSGGALVWFAALALYLQSHALDQSISFAAASLVLCLLGALLPDTDTPKSKIGAAAQVMVFFAGVAFGASRFLRAGISADAVASTLVIAVCVFVAFVFIRPHHRGATHSLRAGLVYGIAVFVFFFLSTSAMESVFFGLVAFASYFSHLLLDKQITF